MNNQTKKNKKMKKTTTTMTSGSITTSCDVVAVASSLILSILQNDGPCTPKQLRKSIQAQDEDNNINIIIKKSTIRQALQELLDKQRIQHHMGDESKFCIANNNNKEDDVVNHNIISSADNGNIPTKQTLNDNQLLSSSSSSSSLPIAMRLRQKDQRIKNASKLDDHVPPPQVDLDDEIARLEQELAQQSDNESSYATTDEDNVNDFDHDDNNNNNNHIVMSTSGRGQILSYSKFSKDRVEPLPPTALPQPGRYHPNNADGSKNTRTKSKKRARVETSSENNITIVDDTGPVTTTSGLEKAVQEVLQGYQARSSERLPFYCRFCARQYSNEKDFVDHKSTEFHQVAVRTERKSTYCKLCRLQLTSLVQMKEHLSSRPHQQRLQYCKKRQQMPR
jgi:hypothetical protein